MACVIRTTFRLHDNPLLERGLADPAVRTLVVPIDTDRVPQVVPRLASNTVQAGLADAHAWGGHQYHFLLLVVRSFVADVRRRHPALRVVVCCAPLAKLVGTVVHYAGKGRCYADRTDDPAWDPFDASLASALGTNWCPVTTLTLLDWHTDASCRAFLTKYEKRRVSNQKVKEYVVRRLEQAVAGAELPTKVSAPPAALVRGRTPGRARSASPLRSRRPRRVGGKRTVGKRSVRRRSKSLPSGSRWSPMAPVSASAPSSPPTCDVDGALRESATRLRKAGARPYDLATTALEAYALKHLERTVAAMASVEWEKRLTNVSLGIRDHASDPIRDTSKLSPFFSLGVLSARWAYVRWRGENVATRNQNESVPSSAVAQLLWRETFHATSRLPHWWATRTKVTLPPTQRYWRREPDATAPYGGWRVWRDDDTDPLFQGWRTATTGHADLDESLRCLVQDGWIHHLRRHLVADYLTRGKVRADWMIGERWFRHTLVDHDACINRGNWMWLSASEFSTAQLTRHYGYDTYVERHSYGERATPERRTSKASGGGGTRAPRGAALRRSRTGAIADPNRRRFYRGAPDPRKLYAGHYKSPAAPVPSIATVRTTRARPPTRTSATAPRLHFADAPTFDPDCTPEEVLRLGAFGGTYFRDIVSGTVGKALAGEDAMGALPRQWFDGLGPEQLTSSTYRTQVNHFRVACGGSLDMWETSGWVNPLDPYGWFQWYCHFYDGRRSSDDARQIQRWHKFTNPNGRFVKRVRKRCAAEGKDANDPTVMPGIRQSVLHWGRLRV